MICALTLLGFGCDLTVEKLSDKSGTVTTLVFGAKMIFSLLQIFMIPTWAQFGEGGRDMPPPTFLPFGDKLCFVPPPLFDPNSAIDLYLHVK